MKDKKIHRFCEARIYIIENMLLAINILIYLLDIQFGLLGFVILLTAFFLHKRMKLSEMKICMASFI